MTRNKLWKDIMHANYTSFSKEAFLDDDFFIRSVKYPTEETLRFWTQWIKRQPSNHEEYQQAVEELEFILASAIRINVPLQLVEELWAGIEQELPMADQRLRLRRLRLHWQMAAAILIGLMSFAYWAYQYHYSLMDTVTTSYAQTRFITLPDSSTIILNSHSNIRYAANWRSDRPREVWLNGEGYFDIKHFNHDTADVKAGERFIVHTGDMDVEVLGTKFDVRSRKQDNSVLLISGKVAVKSRAKDDNWHILKPGEVYYINAVTQQSRKSQADVGNAIAWKDRSVILKTNTRLKDIIPELEENYGVSIRLADTTIGNRRLEGVLPLTSQESLFFILRNVTKVEIRPSAKEWLLYNP